MQDSEDKDEEVIPSSVEVSNLQDGDAFLLHSDLFASQQESQLSTTLIFSTVCESHLCVYCAHFFFQPQKSAQKAKKSPTIFTSSTSHQSVVDIEQV